MKSENYPLDIIGDIHGHADKLEELLVKLGYSKTNGCYSHPQNKALFLGDYIDRGPNIRETLQIVRCMVESENAVALMGNHEYNAICFHLHDKNGGHLRKHLIKNIKQHYETLLQYHNEQDEYEDYIEWFKTLPLYYETDRFRAVHACWDESYISYLKSQLVDGKLSEEQIYESVRKGTKLYNAVDITLKGKEIELPDGLNFTDKDGTIRKETRIKWWLNPKEYDLNELSLVPINESQNKQIENPSLTGYYKEDEKPAFFGHYWLSGNPSLFRNNVCCLDYSVANKGVLAAYRLNGEKELENKNIVFV